MTIEIVLFEPLRYDQKPLLGNRDLPTAQLKSQYTVLSLFFEKIDIGYNTKHIYYFGLEYRP